MWLGYAAFFLVPLLLWLIAIVVTKRKGAGVRAFAFIAGSDNRLSLARLQALAWTLVIFGSFAAAMIIHDPITAGTATEQEKAKNDAAAATKNVSDLKKKAEEAEDLAGKAAAAKTEADKKAAKAAEEEKIKAADPKASEDDKAKAKTVAEKERSGATEKAEDLVRKNEALTKVKNDASQAEREAKAANLKAKSFNWVDIPGALLMLAGIAIGSGVFSSLISALNGEDKTACVTAVKQITAAEVANRFPDAKAPTKSEALLIEGKDLGKTGLVKLGRARAAEELAPILLWKEDGTAIVVDVSDVKRLASIALETPNGKLWYELDAGLKLGDFKPHYEFADLFRDDKSPNNLDLMKFQMFGWTVIAILIYSYLFLFDLRADMESLPVVPQSIVILTGLSQAGYLTGKGISNVEKK
jgi:hypothetical protein